MLSQCKIGAIVFFVSDLARSVAFYRDTLGLAVSPLESHDGPLAMAEVGDVTLVFVVQPPRPGDSPVVVFELGGGIDDYAEKLARLGVEIVLPVSPSPDGGLSLDFVDPDRHLLSLHQGPDVPRRMSE